MGCFHGEEHLFDHVAALRKLRSAVLDELALLLERELGSRDSQILELKVVHHHVKVDPSDDDEERGLQRINRLQSILVAILRYVVRHALLELTLIPRRIPIPLKRETDGSCHCHPTPHTRCGDSAHCQKRWDWTILRRGTSTSRSLSDSVH